jgi:hypothetical protein
MTLSGTQMDALIVEMNHAFCYDMIEEYCDFIGKQLNSLQKQRYLSLLGEYRIVMHILIIIGIPICLL